MRWRERKRGGRGPKDQKRRGTERDTETERRRKPEAERKEGGKQKLGQPSLGLKSSWV